MLILMDKSLSSKKGEGRGVEGRGKEGKGKIKPQQESIFPESYHGQVRQLDLTCHCTGQTHLIP